MSGPLDGRGDLLLDGALVVLQVERHHLREPVERQARVDEAPDGVSRRVVKQAERAKFFLLGRLAGHARGDKILKSNVDQRKEENDWDVGISLGVAEDVAFLRGRPVQLIAGFDNFTHWRER